jgi:hypothetical protein
VARGLAPARPATVELVRRGKVFTYELADFKDWALLFDNAVLEIRARDGTTSYWPLDSITCWRVR